MYSLGSSSQEVCAWLWDRQGEWQKDLPKDLKGDYYWGTVTDLEGGEHEKVLWENNPQMQITHFSIQKRGLGMNLKISGKRFSKSGSPSVTARFYWKIPPKCQ